MAHPVSDEVVLLVKPVGGQVKEVTIPRADWDAWTWSVEFGQPNRADIPAILRAPLEWVRHHNQPRRGRKVA